MNSRNGSAALCDACKPRPAHIRPTAGSKDLGNVGGTGQRSFASAVPVTASRSIYAPTSMDWTMYPKKLEPSVEVMACAAITRSVSHRIRMVDALGILQQRSRRGARKGLVGRTRRKTYAGEWRGHAEAGGSQSRRRIGGRSGDVRRGGLTGGLAVSRGGGGARARGGVRGEGGGAGVSDVAVFPTRRAVRVGWHGRPGGGARRAHRRGAPERRPCTTSLRWTG